MAKHTHIHLHLDPDMFGAKTTATADAFEEAKHKRAGGKFATQSGTAQAKPATGAAAYAAKHSKEGVEAARQAAYEKSKQESPLL